MDTEAMLQRFPGPATLYPSRAKWLAVLMACAAFVGIGAFMIWAGWTLTGGLFVGFFSAGVLVALALMLPGASSLTLDGQGFEVVHLYQRIKARWQDVDGFKPSDVGGVVYDDATKKDSAAGRVSASITGRNTSLSDTYGMAAEDLAQVLTRWRERALQGR
jgi:hypothetical protein